MTNAVTRVHVWGSSGYAAAEAIRILLRHPFVELGALESRSHAGERLGDHFPALRAQRRRFDREGSVAEQLTAGDVVMMAGARDEAKSVAPRLLERGARVIDFSADFRLDDEAVYGLTEWNREKIARSSLVANPGCYPTAALLALLPLARFDRPAQIVVDAKSGITGAGRNPAVSSLYAEVAGDIRAYGLQTHRHQPEMERTLQAHGFGAPLLFTPHVVPLARGMLSDAYAIYQGGAPPEHDVRAAFEDVYGTAPFIRLVDGESAPSVAAVTGTNDAELRVDVRSNTVRVLCALDNLGKGAAGQAVQNMNVMLGHPEEAGFR